MRAKENLIREFDKRFVGNQEKKFHQLVWEGKVLRPRFGTEVIKENDTDFICIYLCFDYPDDESYRIAVRGISMSRENVFDQALEAINEKYPLS